MTQLMPANTHYLDHVAQEMFTLIGNIMPMTMWINSPKYDNQITIFTEDEVCKVTFHWDDPNMYATICIFNDVVNVIPITPTSNLGNVAENIGEIIQYSIKKIERNLSKLRMSIPQTSPKNSIHLKDLLKTSPQLAGESILNALKNTMSDMAWKFSGPFNVRGTISTRQEIIVLTYEDDDHFAISVAGMTQQNFSIPSSPQQFAEVVKEKIGKEIRFLKEILDFLQMSY